MPKRAFSFLVLPCVTPEEESFTLEKYLTPDALLTYVLFKPYIAITCHFRVFESYISQTFETAGNLPVKSNVVRDIYYAGLTQWYKDFHVPLLAMQCFMSRKPAEVVTTSLRVICEKVNEGSYSLQLFMAGKQIGEKNAGVINEVTSLLGYFRREYPREVFDLFGHLFEVVSDIQKSPFQD